MLKRFGIAALLTVIAVPFSSLAARADKLKFEIYKDNAMEFRWRLKATNGETLATSGQGYKAKADCKNGVERIMKDAADKLKFEVYDDNKKESRFRIKAIQRPNDRLIESGLQSQGRLRARRRSDQERRQRR